MKVIGFSGYSGAGKTTLMEQLIARLRAADLKVSVVKHAHHAFDIDREGKDSWRHRRAGAYEVVIASDQRLALVREYESRADPGVHDLIAELSDCDWVLVEGFKHSELPKIEVWRAAAAKPVRYPDDRHIVAIATDSSPLLPVPTDLAVLDLNQPDAVLSFLLATSDRYEYVRPSDPGPRPVIASHAQPAAHPPEPDAAGGRAHAHA